MEWEKKAREIQRTHVHKLESLPGGEIILRKFDIKAQQKMFAIRNNMDLDEQGLPTEGTVEDDMEKFHVLVLTEGVLDHNFESDGKKETWDEGLIKRLLYKYPEIEMEIFMAVLGYNSPLEQRNNSTSETPPSGSSQSRSSERELSSVTEGSPSP
jgi:hypothetical protein